MSRTVHLKSWHVLSSEIDFILISPRMCVEEKGFLQRTMLTFILQKKYYQHTNSLLLAILKQNLSYVFVIGK